MPILTETYFWTEYKTNIVLGVCKEKLLEKKKTQKSRFHGLELAYQLETETDSEFESNITSNVFHNLMTICCNLWFKKYY